MLALCPWWLCGFYGGDSYTDAIISINDKGWMKTSELEQLGIWDSEIKRMVTGWENIELSDNSTDHWIERREQ